jgi:hypothetical protein
MRPNLLFLLPWMFLLVAGCVATPPAQSHFSRPANLFPANGFITQRAMFSARGRQFPLNGYLALSQTGGKRLVITENFGHVMAVVMQSSRMFSPKYIRLGVAADLQCVFSGATNGNCPVEMLSPDHVLVKRHGYTLDLRILDVKPAAQPAELFDASKAEVK